jgi:hypothetical protein
MWDLERHGSHAGQLALTQSTAKHRGELRNLFVELASGAGIADPEQLRLIYDGGSVAANLDHNPSIASSARASARALIDARRAATEPDSTARQSLRAGELSRGSQRTTG